ncbi:MAG: ATP-binding protein [Thioalkalivibrio sp.]
MWCTSPITNPPWFTAAAGVARVRVSVTGGGDDVRVMVADDGPGMAPEVLARVFDRYVSGRPAPARRFTTYDNTATRDAQRRPDWQGRRDTTASRDHAGPTRLAPQTSARTPTHSETGRRAPEHRQERARSDSPARTPSLGSAQASRQDAWHQQRRPGGEITGQRRHEQGLQDRTRQGQVTDTRRSINSRDIPSSHSDRIRSNQAQGWREQARESRPSRGGATDSGRSQTRSAPGWERDSGWQGGRRDGNLNRQHGSQSGFGSRGEGRGGLSR